MTFLRPRAQTRDLASSGHAPTVSVPSLAALKALTNRPATVFMEGYATHNDGGEGTWIWVADDATTANDGTVVQCTTGAAGRYFRVVKDTIRPEWFGAKGDGSTSDSAAVLAAVNACNNQSILLDPKKTGYPFSVTVSASSGCTGFLSVGGRARVVNPPGSTLSTNGIYCQRANFTVENLFFDYPISTDPVVRPAMSSAFRCDMKTGNFVRFSNNKVVGGTTPVVFSASLATPTDGAVDCYITNNVCSNFWGDGFTVYANSNVYITDNILKDGAYTNSASSGVIRTNSPWTGYSENLIIARNTIRNCSLAAPQSAIDCYSFAARNIMITGNILDVNGDNIELKSDFTGDPAIGYRNIVISNNLIRVLYIPTKNTGGIILNHTSTSAPDEWSENILIENNHIFCDSVDPGDNVTRGISGNNYKNVTIRGNQIYNVSRGITMSPQYTVSALLDDLVIADNTIFASVYGIITSSAGTINNLRITNNNVRAPTAVILQTATVNNPSITGNTFKSESSIALTLQAVVDGSVSGNVLIGYSYGLYVSGTGTSGLLVSGNVISTDATSGNNAVLVDTGNTISLRNNQITVPSARRAYSGAGTVNAANNVRGTTTTAPTDAASVGDMWMNSAPAAGSPLSWVCTTAGNAGAATFTPLLLGYAAQLGNAYAAGAPTATGYINIKDSAGATYKVLVST